MRKRNFVWLPFLLLCFDRCFEPSGALACDLCAIHNAVRTRTEAAGKFDLGFSEQFTYYGRLQEDGKHAQNDLHQRLQSSTTQLSLGYGLTDRIGAHLTLPFIVRNFRRAGEDGADTGQESGLGDISLLGRFTAFQHQEPEITVLARFLVGVKLPTGETDRLGEEVEEGHHEEETGHHDEEEDVGKHGGLDHEAEVRSVIHGHDLSLGSGSYDAILGANFFLQHKRIYFLTDVQYALRSEGDFDYRYANDLLFNLSPGVFLITEHNFVAALGLNFSGEYKEKDVLDGNKENDTAITVLALGPELVLKLGESVEIGLAADMPAYLGNSGRQILMDYRLRLGLSGRF